MKKALSWLVGLIGAIGDHTRSKQWGHRQNLFGMTKLRAVSLNRIERLGDVFRRVFERVVEASIAAGLVGGEGFAVDASLIAARLMQSASI